METELLYFKDSYLKEWEAEILESNNNTVILNKTAFYFQSGGQPYDLGTINNSNIISVKKENENIIHSLDKPIETKTKVKCKLNWERRYKLMKMHTAAHIISAVIHKETKALITGNQLDIEKSRIDFSLEDFNKEDMEKYIEKSNEEVNKDHKITTSIISLEEAKKIENLSRLAKGLPSTLKEIRIVKIGDLDEQADGGTHVNSTKEIGKIKLLSIDNKGKNNRRMYFTLEN